MKAWSKEQSRHAKETRENNQINTETLIERNHIGQAQVDAINHLTKVLCRHRNVTVTDVGFCDDCGSVVDYDKETRQWK
jgi:hypothetical protein